MAHPLVVNRRRRVAYDVYVGRPSIWGNPFSHRFGTRPEFRVDTQEDAIDEYARWLREQPQLVERAKRELRGKVLACWCAPEPCHAEVLARIANEEAK